MKTFRLPNKLKEKIMYNDVVYSHHNNFIYITKYTSKT